MKFGSRKAGDGQATAQIDDNPDSPGRLTKNRTLPQPSHGKPQFGWSGARRMRLSVRTHAQNALFRRMRFSSPAQTSSHLTEKRILPRPPHGKAHSGPAASRKSALCSRSSIAAGPKSALCPGASPKTALCAALALLITKGVVLKAPVLVDAIAVDLVLGYAYTARVEDRDARVRMPIDVRLEHPLVRVSVHKGCPRR